MALCVQVNSDNSLSAVSPQPADMGTCAYVVTTSAEYTNNPLALNAQDGAVIGSAILLCWAGAYVVRAILAALSTGDEPSAS